ncbi:MAG: hypothetical protein PHE33_09530 [Bacteroidales bacterium]|nr:hypothetical protein [Bacteroidales bacterium]
MDLEKYKPNRVFLLYKTPNGNVKVDVLLQNETTQGFVNPKSMKKEKYAFALQLSSTSLYNY